MQSNINPNPLHQDCLSKLQQILDLAMQTAEAASAEGNHKIVLQAVREVTRIITLMTKLAGAPDQAAAPVMTQTPAQAAQDPDIEALSNGLVQDVLKIFPGLVSNLETDNPKPKGKNRFFWKREKGGKIPGKTSPLEDIVM
jgi:hypothetical protein